MNSLFKFKSIKGKIIFGFSIVFAMIFVMIVMNHLGFKRINGQTEEIVDKQFPLALANRAMSLNIAETLADIRGYMVYRDEKLLNQLNETIEEGKDIEQNWLKLANSSESKDIAERKAEWTNLIQQAATEASAGRNKQANTHLNEARPITEELNTDFKQLLDQREAEISKLGTDIKRIGSATDVFIIILGVVVLVVGIVIAFITARTIIKPILSVMNRMNTIASGDLSEEPLESRTKDETAQLITSMNAMSANTRELLNQISEVSQVVSSQSEELT